MTPRAQLRIGLIGTVVGALCCFTPVLVGLFGVLGLGALIGWLDLILFPVLALFLAVTGHALWRRRA